MKESSAERMLPFIGIPSFLRAPVAADTVDIDADVVVIGIPSDVGSPFSPGSRFGPRSIREHSMRFGRDGYFDQRSGRTFLGDVLKKGRLIDAGDVNVAPTDVEVTFQRVTESIRHILDSRAIPIVLGGDHAITYPVVRAYDEPLHVVHFDAHIDYSPFEHGFANTNMHAIRYIRQMQHVAGITQVGIRSLRNAMQDVRDAVADGNRVIGMQEFRSLDYTQWMPPAGARCYISIDIDVLDISLVPGCVSAEPDGMTYSELRDALVAIIEQNEVVGLDVVEVNPMLDVGTGITSYLASHAVVECMGHITAQPRWSLRGAAPVSAADG